MSKPLQALDLVLEPADNQRLASLCGPLDEQLRLLETRLGVEIRNRGNRFQLLGDAPSIHAARTVINDLYHDAQTHPLTPHKVHLFLQQAGMNAPQDPTAHATAPAAIKTRRGTVQGRGTNQRLYLDNIRGHDVNFGVGPAGTGKTYLAVACAVESLEAERVRRVVLVRPAVEAGERLGFLPGDLAQKIDPYLRPLYDARYELLGFERVAKLMERNIIEVAPLAYMRGRTLSESFIILDEAQNTTTEQMKMFLTRAGFGSTVVITGDITQIDLPRDKPSGLIHALAVLKDVEGISVTRFSARDVVRLPLVARIVAAYEAHEGSVETTPS